MRFGNIYGFPYGLQWINIRHAHSHLMFFSWVTPPLMALIFARLPEFTGREIEAADRKKINVVITLLIIFGLMAYTVFMGYGYGRVPIGRKGLPLAVIISGLSGIVWYGYMWHYKKAVKGHNGRHAVRLWNGSVWSLLLSSIAAWGVAVSANLGDFPPIIATIFTHLFLDLFSEGWFILAVLGLIYASNPAAETHRWTRKSETLLFIGIPIVFLLSIPTHLLPMSMRLLGSLSALLVGLGLWGNVIILWPHVSKRWRVPLIFLAIKATSMLFAVIPQIAEWAEWSGMHVSYLHWMLLGFVTLGLIAAAEETWGKEAAKGWKVMTTAVILLILTLLLLTAVLPAALAGRWTLHAVAWATVLPILTIIWMLYNSIKHTSSQP